MRKAAAEAVLFILFLSAAFSDGLPAGTLRANMEIVELNTQIPVYIKGNISRSDYSGVKVTMPAKIGLEGHPRLFMSRAEIVKWREEIKKTESGAAAFKGVIRFAEGWVKREVVILDQSASKEEKDKLGDPGEHKGSKSFSMGAGGLGWAYQLTDNEAYAVKAREILLGLAKNPPLKQTRLGLAMWYLPLIQSYDMIYEAKCMTIEDRKLIESGLVRPVIAKILMGDVTAYIKKLDAKNPKWRTEEPATAGKLAVNWESFFNATFVESGIVMGDQNWIDVGAANTRFQIARGIGDDGLWREGSISYQYFSRLALIGSLEPLARQGIDVYSTAKFRLKNLFDAANKFAYPDGTLPGINDAGRSNLGGDYSASPFDYGWLRFRDPAYGAMVNAAPRHIMQASSVYFPTLIFDKLPEQPVQEKQESIIFDNMGYNIMRGENNGNPTYILLKTSAPTGGPHDHPDCLNLVIFADGDELCGESKFYFYTFPEHAAWTKTTLSHYSLTVDQQNQAKCGGRLTGFYDAGSVKIMRGQCEGAYTGVDLDRTMVQMPGYIVDVYQAWSKKTHTFDYPLVFPGELAALKGVAASSLKTLGEQVGYKSFMAQEPSTIGGNWTGLWSREAKEKEKRRAGKPANEINVTVLGDGETKVFNGIVAADDRQQRVILRRTGTSAIFGAIIEPFKDLHVVKTVENIKVEGPVPGYGIKVERADGGKDLIIVRLDSQKNGKPAAASSFNGGSTDALVSVIRMDASGKVIETGLLGGTKLVSGGKNLGLSAPGIKWEK